MSRILNFILGSFVSSYLHPKSIDYNLQAFFCIAITFFCVYDKKHKEIVMTASKDLDHWIESNGIKRVWFAKKMGVNNATLWRWVEGKSRPSKAVRFMIQELTKGDVDMENW
jgi:hypothetical protein